MATCWLSQTGAIFVLLAIFKPCIRFRWSLYRFQPKSTPLSSGNLGLPSWGQVQSFLSKSCICIAYRIPHIIPCFASCCLCFARGWLCLPLLVVLAWVEPGDEYVIEEPVEYAYEDQVNSENFAGKMTIPSKSLVSLLARCSLFCYAYAAIPTTCYIMPPILLSQDSNPPCPSKPLFGYVTALLSPSYSVASCRWRLEFVPCWNMLLLGYHYYILFTLMHLYTW